MRYFGRRLFTGGLLLLFYTVAIYQAAGKGQKLFLDLFKSFFLIVFNLHLELPSDHQEYRNGFAVERLWFLGHGVHSKPFRHLKSLLLCKRIHVSQSNNENAVLLF